MSTLRNREILLRRVMDRSSLRMVPLDSCHKCASAPAALLPNSSYSPNARRGLCQGRRFLELLISPVNPKP